MASRMKTCYYELLGVEATATDAELKKAYRRKALQLHPDKNPDDVDGATARFALVRAAYEVLLDPQERSWYDSHKSLILRDDDEYSGDYEEEYVIPSISSEELMRYFNPAMYTQFDDTLLGFFNIVSRLFERLAAEEITHGKSQGAEGYAKYQDDAPNANVLDDLVLMYPRYGTSTSDYGTKVRVFYSKWGSFQTVKSFQWKDEYRYSSAQDRRTRRLMEKENKRARDAARKEFNETVRKFVAFIKKRDPRVKLGVAEFEKQKKQKQNEALAKQAKQQSVQERLQRMDYEAQDWEQLDLKELEELEELLKKEYLLSSSDSEFDEFEDEEDQNYYECIICNKFFKSEKQFETHEASNKHKKLVKRMKWEMRKEGRELGIDKEDVDLDEFETASENERDEEDEQDMDDEHSEEASGLLTEVKDVPIDTHLEVDDDVEDIDDIDSMSLEADTPEPAVQDKTKAKEEALEKELAELLGNAAIDDDSDDWGTSKKTKKKKKRGTPDVTAPKPEKLLAEMCVVCNEKFSSRNKLFQHVNATGHAAPKKKGKKRK